MKKSSKHNSKKDNSRIRSAVSAAHVLIAVVAIIECLILIAFTTYSWIETSSTLIIETGKKSLTDSAISRIPIAKALDYKFTPEATASDTSLAPLNDYFSLAGQSSTQNLYRYARVSSSNGKNFYMKSGGSTAYRLGDTTDINSSYTYFDFVLSNTGGAKDHKLKFYFANADVFNVSNDTSSLTDAQLATVKNAMRISFQTGPGTPKIYSQTVQTYGAVSQATGGTTSVTTTEIQASDDQKLFTIGKNTEQRISVRIWLEEKANGLSGITGEQLAGLNISVNLKLTYIENDYDYLFFDDYTFSAGLKNKENIGGHLTEDYPESDNYRMYFVYRTSNTTTGYVYPMTIDNSGSNVDANCWVTCDTSGNPSASVPDITGRQFITALTSSSNSTTALRYSYFAYGKCALSATNTSVTLSSATNALYTWRLYDTAASDAVELRYNAYSVTATSASNATSSFTVAASSGYGAGGWSYATPLSMVYFRDLATGNTANAYNSGTDNTNFKYITKAVNAASDTDGSTTTHRANVMYLNIASSFTSDETNARTTATLYYDTSLDGGTGLFKSWVPTSWLSSPSYFRYCAGGYYNNNNATSGYCAISWSAAAATKPSNANDYIYTALGYNSNRAVTDFTGSTTIATGAGCWNAIEQLPINFSTELIDNWATSAYRYQIGVKINNSGSFTYYDLIPDETNMNFYAYIPVPGTNASPATDYAAGAICFRSYASHNNGAAVNAIWLGNVRKGSRTFYPVKINSTTTTTDYTRGYWNISVIVDGTYEHFFWDYGSPSTTDDDAVLGTFSYNTVGHTGSPAYTDITPNKIDEYRWYIPLDSLTTIPASVYYRWIPYDPDGTANSGDETAFYFTHRLSDGLYCVITEAADTTPTNAFN